MTYCPAGSSGIIFQISKDINKDWFLGHNFPIELGTLISSKTSGISTTGVSTPNNPFFGKVPSSKSDMPKFSKENFCLYPELYNI